MNARVLHALFGLLIAVVAAVLFAVIALPFSGVSLLACWSAVHLSLAAFGRVTPGARAIRLGWPTWVMSGATVLHGIALGLVPLVFSFFVEESTAHADDAVTLTLGATSVVRRARTSTAATASWIRALLERRPARVVTVAMANKTARITWAVLARGQAYHVPTIA